MASLYGRAYPKSNKNHEPVSVVEIRGLEPRTSCMPCKRSSQLSYIPEYLNNSSKTGVKNKAWLANAEPAQDGLGQDGQ